MTTVAERDAGLRSNGSTRVSPMPAKRAKAAGRSAATASGMEYSCTDKAGDAAIDTASLTWRVRREAVC